MFNGEQTIEQTIDSVIAQTYVNWEMIIVDDKSTDNSTAIVLKYAKVDPRIKLFQLERNIGTPYYARNYATDRANGDYIAFLDSDDLWLPEKLEKQLKFMVEHGYAIVYSFYERISSEGNRSNRIVKSELFTDGKIIMKSNPIGCLTAIYDCHKVGKLYQIDHKHEDYIMWISVLQKGFVAYCYPEVLALYRVSANSISNAKLKMALVTWDIYRNVFKLSLLKSLQSFLSYSINGLTKYLK
jgi:teichuronic acid biosynthesis glycosyltransferase TuaG